MSLFFKSWTCQRCLSSVRSQSSRLQRPNRKFSSGLVAQYERPFRLAIIGSGPAGFYTAAKVLKEVRYAKIDMYEALPTPFGLVRYGVAPDHPEVKNCEERFREVAEDPGFTYIGNTPIGNGPNSLPLDILAPHYHAILFAYGASKDRRLGIPGESEDGDNGRGIYSARSFVGWYNGLPEYSNVKPNLQAGEDAIVIGNGNVAMDVARILLSDVSMLRKTDITEEALDTLATSKIKRVRVVGRRGVVQSAFTTKEARELMHLPGVSFEPLPSDILPAGFTKKLPRKESRKVQLLQKGSLDTNGPKRWSLMFNLRPTEFTFDEASGHLRSMSFEKMGPDGDVLDPNTRSKGLGEFIDVPADLCFRSIGYKAEPLSGLESLGVQFDESGGRIPTSGVSGKVVDENNVEIPGLYSVGWVKTGPVGVIARTVEDSMLTGNAIAEDWQNPEKAFLGGERVSKYGWEGLNTKAKERGLRPVHWNDWLKIDKAEQEKGAEGGKPREKFTSVEEMLRVLS